MATKQCEVCGAAFKAYKYRIERGMAKFCSRKCYVAGRWGHTGRCHRCGKKCDMRFCSSACQIKHWNSTGHMEHKRIRNWERKLALIEKLGGKCGRCGNGDMRVLDINHLDRSSKKRPHSGKYSWARRFSDWNANVGKLELLCANCHRVHTWDQMGWGSGLEIAIQRRQSVV